MTETTASSDNRSGLRYWAPLVATCLAMFITVVDSTMMNVAVPTIVGDLGTNVSAVQATISFYALVMASLMLTGGKLGAIRGVRRMFTVGLFVYGIGTLVAAVSWNVGVLAFGWAFLEGVGAALIIPLAFTLVVANYEGRHRALSFGVLAGVQASAAAVGPILGGILTTYASWRVGFAGEVVIAVAILPLIPFMKELITADEHTTMDWGGTVLSSTALFSMVTAFLLAGYYGWWEARRPFMLGGTGLNPWGLSPTPWLIALGLLLAAAFIHWQFRREKQDRTPLVRLRILANGDLMAGVSTYVFRSIALSGFLFVLPLYHQSVLGYSAFDSGLAILPFSIATFVVAMVTAGWNERIAPRRLVQAGFIIMGLGLALFISSVNLTMSIAQQIIPGLVFGAGLGLVMAQLMNLALSSVKPVDTPEASGVQNAMGELGNSIGTAVIGSLLMSFYYGGLVDGVLGAQNITAGASQRQDMITRLEDALADIRPEMVQQWFESLKADLQQQLVRIIDGSMLDSMKWTLLVIGGMLLGALLMSTFLPGERDISRNRQHAAEEELEHSRT